MNPETANWVATADYDLQTARSLFKSRRYVYVVFMCHLSIEKLLKALVCESTNAAPPRTHDLKRLLEMADVTLEPPLAKFVADLSTASVATRYPEDLSGLVTRYPRSTAETYVEQTEEVIRCLRKDPRLQP